MAYAIHISVICDHSFIVKGKSHNEAPWGHGVHTLDFPSLFFSLSFPPSLFLSLLGNNLPYRHYVCVFLQLINASPASQRQHLFQDGDGKRGKGPLRDSAAQLQAFASQPLRLDYFYQNPFKKRDSDFMQEDSPGFQLTRGHAADPVEKKKKGGTVREIKSDSFN